MRACMPARGPSVTPALLSLPAGDRLHPKGVLLFNIFGRETVDKVCMMGFNVTVLRMHNGAHGIIGENAWVFVTTKPGGGVLQQP